MDGILTSLAATELAAWLRVSRWGYAAVNAGHILGIAMLVGATLPLNLRLLGIWPDVPHTTLANVLVPVAAAGLALAIAMGTLLFIVRAPEYSGLGVFQAKMALAAIATASALLAHCRFGWQLQRTVPARLRFTATISLLCWLGALMLGRVIGFVD